MRNVIIERWEGFSTEQRISVVILGICGVLAVGLSLYYIQSTIRDPFLADKEKALAFKQSLAPSPDEVEAKQKRTDTDGDGLSDWDEVNVFHTNPNLKDSCGDGVPDNIRIATGKNLDCSAKAKNPYGDIDTSGVESTSTNLLQNQLGGPTPDSVMSSFAQTALQMNAVSQGATTTESASFILRDPKAIRAALTGKVDQARLDSISDAQLLQYYDTVVAQQNQAASVPSSSSSTTP